MSRSLAKGLGIALKNVLRKKPGYEISVEDFRAVKQGLLQTEGERYHSLWKGQDDARMKSGLDAIDHHSKIVSEDLAKARANLEDSKKYKAAALAASKLEVVKEADVLPKAPEATGGAKEAQGPTYEQFEKQYRDTFKLWMSYKPEEIGSRHYAEIISKMADEHPDWVAKIEAAPEPAQEINASKPVVVAAAYRDKAGNMHTAGTHIEAAKRAGFAAPEKRGARETPEYQFKVQNPDGKTRFVSRKAAEKIARDANQLRKGVPKGAKLHSDEIEMAHERKGKQKFSEPDYEDAGYKNEAEFERAFDDESLKEHDETRLEFLRRKYCGQ